MRDCGGLRRFSLLVTVLAFLGWASGQTTGTFTSFNSIFSNPAIGPFTIPGFGTVLQQPPPQVPVGDSQRLQDAVLAANSQLATQILMDQPSPAVLAAGFQAPWGALQPSTNRFTDPDVILMKAIASAALNAAGAIATLNKLAQSMVLSVIPPAGHLPPGVDRAALRQALLSKLQDTELMTRVLYGSPYQYVRKARRLQCSGCSGPGSFVCGLCWPGSICNEYWWCAPY